MLLLPTWPSRQLRKLVGRRFHTDTGRDVEGLLEWRWFRVLSDTFAKSREGKPPRATGPKLVIRFGKDCKSAEPLGATSRCHTPATHSRGNAGGCPELGRKGFSCMFGRLWLEPALARCVVCT